MAVVVVYYYGAIYLIAACCIYVYTDVYDVNQQTAVAITVTTVDDDETSITAVDDMTTLGM